MDHGVLLVKNKEVMAEFGSVITGAMDNTGIFMRDMGAVGIFNEHAAVYRTAMTRMDGVVDRFGTMVEKEERRWVLHLLGECLKVNKNTEYTAGIEMAIREL